MSACYTATHGDDQNILNLELNIKFCVVGLDYSRTPKIYDKVLSFRLLALQKSNSYKLNLKNDKQA